MADTDRPRLRPFSCGSQWMDWQDANCCRCARVRVEGDDMLTDCPLFLALSRANVRDGTVDADTADRLGLTGNENRYVWPCRELELVRDGNGKEV